MINENLKKEVSGFVSKVKTKYKSEKSKYISRHKKQKGVAKVLGSGKRPFYFTYEKPLKSKKKRVKITVKKKPKYKYVAVKEKKVSSPWGM